MLSKSSTILIFLALAPCVLCQSSTAVDVFNPLDAFLGGTLNVLINIKNGLSSLIGDLNVTIDATLKNITSPLQTAVNTVVNVLDIVGKFGGNPFKDIVERVQKCTLDTNHLPALTQLLQSTGNCIEGLLVSILTQLRTVLDNLISIVTFLKDLVNLKIDPSQLTDQINSIVSMVKGIVSLPSDLAGECPSVDEWTGSLVKSGKDIVDLVTCLF